jgi:cytochrome P450
MHTDPRIFGPDAEQYRPERWLQGDGETSEAYAARLKSMKDVDMSFGGGNRVCLGRPLALVELYKVVSFVFRNYDVSAVVRSLFTDWVVLTCVADRA